LKRAKLSKESGAKSPVYGNNSTTAELPTTSIIVPIIMCNDRH